jgi:hypothetical protein
MATPQGQNSSPADGNFALPPALPAEYPGSSRCGSASHAMEAKMLIRNSGARSPQGSSESGHMPKRDSVTAGPGSGAGTSEPSVGRATVGPIVGRSADEPAQSWTPAIAPAAITSVDQARAAGSNPAVHQPHLGPDLQALIGQQLRAVYHEVLNEPVPDRFVRLLEELATKNASRA